MRHVHGVTLIEACIVLCVCTVILTAAAPSMHRMIERQALRGAADELRGDLQYLRTTAVSRGQTLWLALRSGEGGCYVVYAGERGDCACQPSGTAACAPGAEPLKTVAFDARQGLQLQATTTWLGIEPVRGTVTPTATFKLVGRGGEAVHELVNVMGRVRTCSPGGVVPGYKAC
jgi:type IV fimbrial biogenesis protein FimT